MDHIGSKDFCIFGPVQNANDICDAHVNMAVDLNLDAFAHGVYPMDFWLNVEVILKILVYRVRVVNVKKHRQKYWLEKAGWRLDSEYFIVHLHAVLTLYNQCTFTRHATLPIFKFNHYNSQCPPPLHLQASVNNGAGVQ
ncbi:hypothetical protein ARMSODRAFT_1024427 [Armillaria solidipes]|uniref:Uncharacterized protein n=1 Tax=Armillaria solidipes TaxID=1076256 RepID=A0A2H3B9X5_9AGAR|nr:hypothetical protein ARMSODRAFT_1024427 [Armillaria solidipes]